MSTMKFPTEPREAAILRQFDFARGTSRGVAEAAGTVPAATSFKTCAVPGLNEEMRSGLNLRHRTSGQVKNGNAQVARRLTQIRRT